MEIKIWKKNYGKVLKQNLEKNFNKIFKKRNKILEKNFRKVWKRNCRNFEKKVWQFWKKNFTMKILKKKFYKENFGKQF